MNSFSLKNESNLISIRISLEIILDVLKEALHNHCSEELHQYIQSMGKMDK